MWFAIPWMLRRSTPRWGCEMGEERLLILPLALLLDTVLGDPHTAAHPVRLFGALAAQLEALTRRVTSRAFIAGAVTWVFVVGCAVLVSTVLLLAANRVGPIVSVGMAAVLVYVTIAPRDLAVHAAAAGRALERGDIEEARRRAGLMVSRDLRSADESEIVRAVIESTAENLVDGVSAPLLYAAVIGPIGAVVFRAANTLDAMFGYKNESYLEFGRFSAKADDVLAWLPARVTGPLFCLGAPIGGGAIRTAVRIMRRDRTNHESPNGGIVESAAAGALGIRLGGPSVYFGAVVCKPTMGVATRAAVTADIFRTIRMMYAATVLVAFLSAAVWYARLGLFGVIA